MNIDSLSDRPHSGTEAAAYLAAIVDSSDDAIISKNLSGIIQSWNKGAERIFGYTATETIGQSILLLIPPELHHEEAMILARLQRGERIEHYETVRQCKDGRRVDIELTVSPVRGPDGRILGASKIARDITERKKAEAKLQQWNEELEIRVYERTHALVQVQERLRALASQLHLTEQRERRRLATTLHDSLAQSLAFIRMKLQQTKRRVGDDNEALSSFITEFDDLVQQCLTETRSIMAHLCPPILHESGLVAALRWLAEQMAVQGLAVEIDISEDEAWPRLQEEREALLFNAIRELLLNVRKHAGVSQAKIRVEEQGERNWHITVSDAGVGFDATQIQTSPSGEHFGLSSMPDRMEIIGGRCVIESNPGMGTRVRLEVPQ
jgi:PAS domain S-box-containing protein